jgi:hypothetical protein
MRRMCSPENNDQARYSVCSGRCFFLGGAVDTGIVRVGVGNLIVTSIQALNELRPLPLDGTRVTLLINIFSSLVNIPNDANKCRTSARASLVINRGINQHGVASPNRLFRVATSKKPIVFSRRYIL